LRFQELEVEVVGDRVMPWSVRQLGLRGMVCQLGQQSGTVFAGDLDEDPRHVVERLELVLEADVGDDVVPGPVDLGEHSIHPHVRMNVVPSCQPKRLEEPAHLRVHMLGSLPTHLVYQVPQPQRPGTPLAAERSTCDERVDVVGDSFQSVGESETSEPVLLDEDPRRSVLTDLGLMPKPDDHDANLRSIWSTACCQSSTRSAGRPSLAARTRSSHSYSFSSAL